MTTRPRQLIIYTVMPDFGGAWGWTIRNGDESGGVGGCHAGHNHWGGEHPISADLEQAFAEWQGVFESAGYHGKFELPFDWASFHSQGIELCRRLKREVGEAARIVYEKPMEDPDETHECRREVLADGSLLLLPSRWQVNRMRLSRLVTRIVSGGQTGADRAALDWAIAHGVAHGGWCTAGRRAEDGVIDARYALTELASRSYRQRTRRNVEDSDATLILNLGELDGGSLETRRYAERLTKPCLVLQLEEPMTDQWAARVSRFLRDDKVRTLNIAGPRESRRPGIHAAVTAVLDQLDQGYEPPQPAGD